MALFDRLTLRGVEFPNRVVVSPMSQYMAQDGHATDYHFAHLARFALGGAGLVFTEATAVEKDGRRTHGDLGLWQDSQIGGLARIAAFVAGEGAVPGIQLGHAGRKASERRPWHGEGPVDEEDADLRGEAPWQTIGPTAEPYSTGWHVPKAMDDRMIAEVKRRFRDAAARAREAGFQVIELYAAHGFLLHQFYSPACNDRNDGYGRDFDGRVRLLLEVVDEVRTEWPDRLPLFVRVSAVDWVDGGWQIDHTVELARRLKTRGVDVLVCSSGAIGGSKPAQLMPVAQGFQVPFAARIRQEADLASMAVGFIWDPEAADAIVREGKADFVALARELLFNPNWTLHAARDLGLDSDFAGWKPQFGWWLNKRERLISKLGLRATPTDRK